VVAKVCCLLSPLPRPPSTHRVHHFRALLQHFGIHIRSVHRSLAANNQLPRAGGKETLIVLGGRDERSAFLIGSADVIEDPRLLSYGAQQDGVDNMKNAFMLRRLGVRLASELLFCQCSNVIHAPLVIALET